MVLIRNEFIVTDRSARDLRKTWTTGASFYSASTAALISMNYSKWDKYAAELTDSEDEAETSKPTVKVLGDNQAVKIGPDGYKVESPAVSVPQSSKPKSDKKENALEEPPSAEEDTLNLTTNGSKGSNYYWRQNRNEVILTVLLPTDVKGKDLSILFDSNTRVLTVVHAPSTNILSGPLRYTINTENMACNSSSKSLLTLDPEDWEILTLTGSSGSAQSVRALEITLRKLSPLPGAIFWWRNCFEGEEEIDVTKIAGRTNMMAAAPGAGAGGAGGVASNSAENDPFVQAQKMFLEKMKTHEKVEVDLSEP